MAGAWATQGWRLGGPRLEAWLDRVGGVELEAWWDRVGGAGLESWGSRVGGTRRGRELGGAVAQVPRQLSR